MTDTTLPHRLDRTIRIRADRDTVFRFFTDEGRWATWWGAGSSIDSRPGGRMLIRYPNGVEASGEVVSSPSGTPAASRFRRAARE